MILRPQLDARNRLPFAAVWATQGESMATWMPCRVCNVRQFLSGSACEQCDKAINRMRQAHRHGGNGHSYRDPRRNQVVAVYAALVMTGHRLFEETTHASKRL